MYVRIKAKRAMFCSTIFRTERMTYPVPTPSAIAGALGSIYCKPQMYYEVLSILVVNRPRFASEMSRFVVNEATGISPSSVPRSEMILKDVDYVCEIKIHLNKANDTRGTGDNVVKHYEMLERRLRKGQYFMPPYLGKREFGCEITYLSDEEASEITSELKGYYPLPIMPKSIPLDPVTGRPGKKDIYYHPHMFNGFIDCTKDYEYEENEEGDLLKNLVNMYDMHCDELGLPKDGYQFAKITYQLILGQDGEPKAFLPADITESGKVRSVVVLVPLGVAKSANISANFLWAEADYVLGMDPKRGEQKLKAFKNKIKAVAGENPPEKLKAVLDFYEKMEEWKAVLEEMTAPFFDLSSVKGSGNITFVVEDEVNELVARDPEVKQAWEKWCFAERRGEVKKCMITGKEEMIVEGHPLVKGVKDAGSMGRLISIDKNSSDLVSHGHVGLEGCPISISASFKLHTALNWMLANGVYKQDTSRGTLIFWTRNNYQELQSGIKALFDESIPKATDVRRGEPFYFMELRGNGAGRVFVRSYQRFVTGEDVRYLREYLMGLDVAVNLNKLWEDEEVKETNAYLLGKLFAQIQIAQMDAIQSTQKNGGIEKSYYTLALARPDIAFERLHRLLSVYLSKKDFGIGNEISDTLTKLEDFDPIYPEKFSVQEKAMFAHGYTKNIAMLKAERWARIEEANEKKKEKEEKKASTKKAAKGKGNKEEEES